MNKKIIAMAIAAATAAPAFADVTVSGAVRQSIDHVDNGNTNYEAWQINDRLSNLKFSGNEDLGNGLKAIFSIQYFLGISNERASSTDLDDDGGEFNVGAYAFGQGNAFVGLAGDFGTVLVGRHDHPVKMSTGRLDVFSNTIADNGMTFQNGADLRANGAIAYVSPSFSGLKIAAAMVPGEDGAVGETADGLADAWSVAAMYSNGGLYASLGFEEGDTGMDGVTAAQDYDQTRVGIGYTMDAFHANVVYTDLDAANGAANDYDSWKIAGTYTMGNNKFKIQYWDQDYDASTTDEDGWAIGIDHNFSKRTQAQINYMSIDDNGGTANSDLDVFSVQMNHSF